MQAVENSRKYSSGVAPCETVPHFQQEIFGFNIFAVCIPLYNLWGTSMDGSEAGSETCNLWVIWHALLWMAYNFLDCVSGWSPILFILCDLPFLPCHVFSV